MVIKRKAVRHVKGKAKSVSLISLSMMLCVSPNVRMYTYEYFHICESSLPLNFDSVCSCSCIEQHPQMAREMGVPLLVRNPK